MYKRQIAGLAVSFILRFGGGDPILRIPQLIPCPWRDAASGPLFPFKTLAMICGLAAIYAVSKATARLCPPRPLDPGGPARAG